MLGSFFNAFSFPDIRKRIFWLLGGLGIYALCVQIPVPGVDREAWQALLQRGDIFQLLGMFTGGALTRFSIAAMGITPYINASIIMQLMTVVWPGLKEKQRSGEQGRKEVTMYTRGLTFVLSLLQATLMVVAIGRIEGTSIFKYDTGFYLFMVILTLVTGTAFLVWLGEMMSEKGIGNGVSLLIFAGIVISFPEYLYQSIEIARETGGFSSYISLIIFFIASLLLIVSIVVMTIAHRKVPVVYARRQEGQKVYGGQTSYIPIRVNNAGVMSLIFAISIVFLPSTIVGFASGTEFGKVMEHYVSTYFTQTSILFNLAYMGFVIFFTFFYSAITFNTNDMAENLHKASGSIPGVRPGADTADYLDKIVEKLNLVSGVYLALLAVVPTILVAITGVNTFFLGPTSLLIIVGVALDTMQQIEARMVMKQYKGFLK